MSIPAVPATAAPATGAPASSAPAPAAPVAAPAANPPAAKETGSGAAPSPAPGTPAPASGDTGAPGAATAAPAQSTTETPALTGTETPADLQAIFTAHPELRATWDKHFTQKSQAIAEQSRQVDAHRSFISSFQKDPRAAVLALAKQLDIPIAKETSAAPSQMVAARAALVEEFGEETADKLLPVIQQTAEAIVEARVGPHDQERQKQIRDTAAQAAISDLEAFQAANPDWQKYEPAMLALMDKVEAGEGMSRREYLDMLYREASYDERITAEAAKLVARQAAAAEASASGASAPVIPSTRVTGTRPEGKTSIADAFYAAKRGENWAATK